MCLLLVVMLLVGPVPVNACHACDHEEGKEIIWRRPTGGIARREVGSV